MLLCTAACIGGHHHQHAVQDIRPVAENRPDVWYICIVKQSGIAETGCRQRMMQCHRASSLMAENK